LKPQTEFEAGNEIDGFCIESRLHADTRAAIYAVTRDDLPGPAVMKVPRFAQGESGVSAVSFEVEQMVLDALQGGVVPQLYASADLAHNPYLVMEFIEGATLLEVLQQAPLSAEDICRLGAAAALAVQHLHQHDVIHLDLKPANIIIKPDGNAVLIGLGLAHHIRLPDLLAEEFRKPLGSAPYISPEQVLGVRNEMRSDIFALGVILYQFATRHLPFGDASSIEGLRKRLNQRPTPPRAYVPTLPDALQEVIYRCLEVSASNRYANAGQLAFDLQHLDKVKPNRRGRWRRRLSVVQRLRDWLVGSQAMLALDL